MQRFQDDDARWQAFINRDRSATGAFVLGVLTTGVYCRAGCPGRPNRRNTRFFADSAEACAAGLRPCKRCKPDQSSSARRMP